MDIKKWFISDSKLFWFALRGFAKVVSPFSGKGKVTILIYHQVLPEKDSLRPDCVVNEDFDLQMRLIKNIFNVVSLDEAVLLLKSGKKLPSRSVVITFDDGYADNFTEALPILKKYGLPATFYIAGEAIKKGVLWNDTVCEIIKSSKLTRVNLDIVGLGDCRLDSIRDKNDLINQVLEKLKPKAPEVQWSIILKLKDIFGVGIQLVRNTMTEEQLIGLSREEGMAIGCHTMSHPMLSYVGIDDAERDILESKMYLESIIKKPIKHFSYPYGKYGEHFHAEHLNLVASMGFDSAVTTNWGAVDNHSSRFFLKRFTPWDKNPLKFYLRICNNFN